MSAYIPVDLRSQIEQAERLRRAKRYRGRCCYCLTQSVNSGIPLSFDHVLPRSQGGVTTFENVCLACRSCNEVKSDLTAAIDPLTGDLVPLFNPRQQRWAEHFTWSEDGTRVLGQTAVGRATVLALQMNRVMIVVARRRWVAVGWHPPEN